MAPEDTASNILVCINKHSQWTSVQFSQNGLANKEAIANLVAPFPHRPLHSYRTLVCW